MPAASTGAGPIGAEEAQDLFRDLERLPRLALAVSGGRDSMALLRLVARWAGESEGRPEIAALTVDHGLRAGSSAEAAEVARWCAALGIRHHTLTWRGPKPRTGVEERAREARYQLLTGWCRDHQFSVLALAHQLDDQAETVLMRLSRSSGIDGLAAMAPRSERGGITIVRPLLSFPRARLEATLSSFGQPWIDDPSNTDPAFARARLRSRRGTLEDLGLSAAAIGASAAKLARASNALKDIAVARFASAVTIAPAGYVLIDADALTGDPRDIVMRVLARAIEVVSGGSRLADAALERVAAGLGSNNLAGATLGHCRLTRRGRHILVVREGRSLPRCRIEPGASLVWDDRFRVTLAAGERHVEIGALGPRGFAAVRRMDKHFSAVPASAGAALPGGFRGDGLVLAPRLGGEACDGALSVRFLRLGADRGHA
jgi:tRNA(Ile)-lysidine synthase